MKTITVSAQSTEVNSLLEHARQEDVVVRAADGAEFMLTAIDDFDHEIARTRHNSKLMELLEERAKRSQTIPLNDVKKQLGL